MASDRIRLIHGVGPTLMKEVERYRSKVTPPTKNPERFSVSPEGFPATSPQTKLDQAICFRFLRQPSSPNAPSPVAKSGRAAGSGVVAGPASN